MVLSPLFFLKSRFVFQAWHEKEVVFDFGFMKNWKFFIKPKSKTFLNFKRANLKLAISSPNNYGVIKPSILLSHLLKLLMFQ
jgi:hypothetical protein